MKKSLLVLFSLLLMPSFGSDKIHVKALDNFDTQNPNKIFNVEIIENGKINGTIAVAGDILYGNVVKITDPKKGKRNAGIYLEIYKYKDKYGEHNFSEPLTAKYAKTIFSKTPRKQLAKKTATTAGGFFIPGLSYGVSFAEGVKENEEKNKFKSGMKKMYKESFLSYIEEGHEVKIAKEDDFYLIIKTKKD